MDLGVFLGYWTSSSMDPEGLPHLKHESLASCFITSSSLIVCLFIPVRGSFTDPKFLILTKPSLSFSSSIDDAVRMI